MKIRKVRKRRDKRAVFFSTDALIALTIIFLSILVIYPLLKYPQRESFIQEDVLAVLSSLKIGEIDNSYVQTLISDGKVTDLNKTVLEQIGEFYITDLAIAEDLSEIILSFLDTKENIGIWYGDTLLASKNSTPINTAKDIEVDRQIISGMKGVDGGEVTGFSARAYLTSALQKNYFYFGGYIGDGNISVKVDYDGVLENIKIEIAVNKDFDIYINDQYSGHYEKSPSDFNPATYDLGAYLPNFISGENTVKFAASEGNLHIAGGYIKITYEDSVRYNETKKYNFPGIDGIINIYDGFYVPGQLNSIDVFLHLDSNYKAFLIIGNITVFSDLTSGEETITIPNSQLSSLFDYSDLSQKTIPLRLGLENVSYVSNITQEADVFSVTDLSGSMNDCISAPYCVSDCPAGQPETGCCEQVWWWTCSSGYQACDECKIGTSKVANKEFVDAVLNVSSNRVGLVGYSGSIENYHPLTNNKTSLKNGIDQYEASGWTCICCGINEAKEKLTTYSDASKYRSIVIMSDGEANVECAEQGTGSATQDAIQAACDAFNNYGIMVHAIGFGTDADEATLQAIATCGNGSYYYADVGNLVEIYQQIAQEIIEASYVEQTIEIITGNISTILYPDSYIEFGYVSKEIPYGLIMTTEKQFIDEYHGNFSIPSDSGIIEVKAISYSGPRWTDNAEINNVSIYKLSDYGQDYIKLGDPYAIDIPNSLVQQSNTVEITTGVSPTNSTAGSKYNKIIYTIIKNTSSYSPISTSAEGCIWTVQFEDNSNLTLNIPLNYAGADNCYYQENRQEYNNNDAIQAAVYNLLKKLDIDLDGKIDVKFIEQDLQISSSEITGIPYTWSTEVQIRKWN